MVRSPRTGVNPAVEIEDGVRNMIQSIKEIVGNHSDADIHAALKEANMDADETTQRLLLQDPFHEVKRRRDRKKEDAVIDVPDNRRQPSDDVAREVKHNKQPEHNVRRGAGYSRGSYLRNAPPRKAFPWNSAAGTKKTFRVVRDNRSNLNVDGDPNHSSARSPRSSTGNMSANVNEKGSAGGLDSHRPGGDRDSIRISDAPVYTESSPSRQQASEENVTVPSSKNSEVGVYSSSTDPVHVPSPDSRSLAVGAIRREVGGGKSSENAVKDSSAHVRSLSVTPLRKDGAPQARRPFSPISKMDQFNQATEKEPVMPSAAANHRPLLNNHHGNRGSQYVRTQHQAGGHPRVSQNKEWKPKLNKKSSGNNPGVIGTPKKLSADDSSKVETEAIKLQDKLSLAAITESQNVIIAEHIRVPETDRFQLTFGSFALDLDSSRDSASGPRDVSLSEKHEHESAPSLPVAPPEAPRESATTTTKAMDSLDDQVRHSGSGSGSFDSTASEQQVPEQKEDSRNSQNIDEYAAAGIELLCENGPPYSSSSESKVQQVTPVLQSFSAYDPQTGYDLPFFRPSMDENTQAQGLASAHEALNTHNQNMAASTMAMMQQQQQPQQAQMAQMYSQQVHVSHYPNMMPYRQYVPQVYVPQMSMQGYSGNPAAAYAPSHPSNNANSFMMMPPGGTSHLPPNALKFGIQPYKPLPNPNAAGPTGFGVFSNPNGYPIINSPTSIGLEDSSRIKYKDGNLYVPNPQAESSEIWMQNPRDHSGLQSAPFYNVSGQTPHGAYISAAAAAHMGHPSFNAAVAAQSPHMQYQGVFQPQQGGPHHHMGGNVGVGVAPSPAAPPPQVGPTYQQPPQVGHMNWPANF